MTTIDERCARCGEDVSMLSPGYDERHLVKRGGSASFLCGSCFAVRGEARDRRRRGMSDDERRRLDGSATVIIAFGQGGH